MAKFVFTYRGPKGYNPTPESTQAWMAWFDTFPEKLVDLGNPVVTRASVGECDSDRTELGGYSIVSADNIEDALAIAKGCPHVERGGGVEVGQLGEVPDRRLQTA
jgi:hypothetical protein